MKDGPNIAKVAGLIGEPARAEMLTALMADRALTATELAAIAGVTKQTVSAHLAKLLDARLVVVESQGRHRYYRLADRDVAALLESLMGVAFRTGAVRLRNGPREPALRKARICYDHLAGELGVLAYDALLARRAFRRSGEGLQLTHGGAAVFAALGIDIADAARQRRALCRPCLDWGERRHHLGGALGTALVEQVMARGWASRLEGSRIVAFTPRGEQAFRALFATDGRAAGAPSPAPSKTPPTAAPNAPPKGAPKARAKAQPKDPARALRRAS